MGNWRAHCGDTGLCTASEYCVVEFQGGSSTAHKYTCKPVPVTCLGSAHCGGLCLETLCGGSCMCNPPPDGFHFLCTSC